MKSHRYKSSAGNLAGGERADHTAYSETIGTRSTSIIGKRRFKVQGGYKRTSTPLIEEVPSRKRRSRTKSSAGSDSSLGEPKISSSRQRRPAREVKYSDGEGTRYLPHLRRIIETKDHKERVHTSSASADRLWSDARKMAFADQVRKSGSWTKKPSNLKNYTSPSVISILSEMTNVSGGSSGSNSTVTQESVSRPKPPRSKRSSPGRIDSKGRTKKESTLVSRSLSPTITERPDVFAYMENDSTTTVDMSIKTASIGEDERMDRRILSGLPEVVSEGELEEHDESFGGVHSESSSSGRGNSPAGAAELETHANENVGRRFAPPYSAAYGPSRPAEQVRVASYTSPSQRGTRRWSNASDSGMGSSVDENSSYDQSTSSPEAYYARAYSKVAQHPDEMASPYRPPRTQMSHSASESPHSTPTDQPNSTVAGYELLASKLSSNPRGTDTLIPIYRKFETLNNRILLYLQDEICEIEEDLHKLDEADAQLNAAMAHDMGHTLPTSRRQEAKMPSEIHFRRLELLGRAFLKVGQYSEPYHPRHLNTLH